MLRDQNLGLQFQQRCASFAKKVSEIAKTIAALTLSDQPFVIIGVGGAIQGHPDGAAEGARIVRAAIDDAVVGRGSGSPPGSGVR